MSGQSDWQYATYVAEAKRCSRCRVEKARDDFYLRNKDQGPWLTSYCKDCFRTLAKDRGRERYEAIGAIKTERGCADCGFDRHPAALEFDHLPGSVKLFNISAYARSRWERLLEEISKCEVVCANCHAIRTFERARAVV